MARLQYKTPLVVWNMSRSRNSQRARCSARIAAWFRGFVTVPLRPLFEQPIIKTPEVV